MHPRPQRYFDSTITLQQLRTTEILYEVQRVNVFPLNIALLKQ